MYNFKQNKYTKIYFNIIENAQQRTTDGYVEKHHIIPKSIGGDNSKTNIVELTAREHFVCHRLLVRMVQDNDTSKMAYASWQQGRSLKQKGIKISSRLYESLKLELSKAYKGKKRMPFSDEWRNNMSLRAIGSNNNMFGKTHSEDSKQLMSQNRTGKCIGVNNPFHGKTHNEDTINKIIEANKKRKGIPKPKRECPHCKRFIAVNVYNKHHGNNCINYSNT